MGNRAGILQASLARRRPRAHHGRVLRYAYNTNGLAHHRFEDAIALVRDAGYDGVGLTLDVHHLDPLRADAAELARARATLDGLEVVIQTGARFLLDPRRKHEPTLLSSDAEGRMRRLGLLTRAVDVASSLGARVVSFWSGRAPKGVDNAELWKRLEAGVGSLLTHAERAGVSLAFEPEPGMWIEGVEGYRELKRRVARPGLGLALDVGHVAVNGEDLGQVLEAHAAEVLVVQIEDVRGRVHEHRMFGEGDLDFVDILRRLRQARYAGLVEVELSRDSHRAHECVPAAIEFLRARERGG
jgi:sugar phosphate isomerase/epimerase